jgi:hypothetical protein
VKRELVFRECARCEFIEDCPHPDVDMEGNPVRPKDCPKEEHEVNLKSRASQNENNN